MGNKPGGSGFWERRRRSGCRTGVDDEPSTRAKVGLLLTMSALWQMVGGDVGAMLRESSPRHCSGCASLTRAIVGVLPEDWRRDAPAALGGVFGIGFRA